MDKYEYLTDKDFRYKPRVVEEAKFEYSYLGKSFSKGLEKEDKKEELLKRLKIVEDNNEEHLKMTNNKESKQLGL